MRIRALSYLFLAGATIGLVSLALPHSHHANQGALLVNIAAAYLGCAATALLSRRLPPWSAHVCLAAGTLIVTRAIYYSGDADSYYSIWYVWIALYAFYFFTRPQAAAHVALVGVSYGALLVSGSAPSGEARWLTTFSTLVIAAVFVDTLVRQLRRHARRSDENAERLRAAAAAMERMASCSSPERLCGVFARAALEASGAGRAEIWTTAPASGEPVLAGRAGPAVDERQAAAATRVSIPLAETGHSLALCFDRPAELEDLATKQVLDVLVEAFSSAFERLDLIRRLEEAARTDELCHLPNRRAWEQELPLQLAHARRFSYPVCVLLLDLDGLKQLNDSRGHQAGDAVLRGAAEAWSAELRDVDTLVRWGGDEFALILPGCDLAEAGPVAARILAATPPPVTCSGGLAQWDGEEHAESLVARADSALYEAKAGGGDGVSADCAPRTAAAG